MPPPPLPVQAKLRQAFELLNAGQLDAAGNLAKSVLKLVPKEPNALYLLGVAAHRAGDLKAAAGFFEKSHKADRSNLAAMSGMGIVRLDQQRFAEAARIFQDLTRKMPGEAIAFNNLGIALNGLGKRDGAEAAFRQALTLNPGLSMAYPTLAGLILDRGAPAEAAVLLETALTNVPGEAGLYHLLADAHLQDGKVRQAEAVLARSVETFPGDRVGRSRLASMWINKGWFDEARGLLDQLVAEDGADPMALFDLADLLDARRKPGDPDPADLRDRGLAAYVKRAETGPVDALLDHRAAQAYEARGRYDPAFTAYSQAQAAFRAALARSGYTYDRAVVAGDFDALIAHFSGHEPAAAPVSTCRSRRPIFIVGMPRSGTSLLEQVLASHPDIHGGGELDAMPQAVAAFVSADGRMAGTLDGLTSSDFDGMAEHYLSALSEIDADRPFVTDKLPMNFQYVGLIRQMFPQALILNIERAPMDVCWSIFVQRFSRDLGYDSDLGDIGHYYRQYDRLMRFWRDWDPGILHVTYEALVADMEAVILPILDRLGLSWHPDMARFFETDRDVLTASRLQVRRPIYKDSIARWRRFDGKLGALEEALGDLASERPAEAVDLGENSGGDR